MCNSTAKIICMCASPCVVMCFHHIRNHTGGRSTHRLKDYNAYQNQQIFELMKITIFSITKHIISDTTKKFKDEGINHIEKITLAGSQRKMQVIQEIVQKNQKVQLQMQQYINYAEDFKKTLHSMRERINKVVIYKRCRRLVKFLVLDNFIENKLRLVEEEFSKRFFPMGEISINNCLYLGEIENELPEGKGVCKFPNGEVYDGEFHDGREEGRGILNCSNGDVYYGEFKGRMPEGRGVYRSADGIVYDGEFFGVRVLGC